MKVDSNGQLVTRANRQAVNRLPSLGGFQAEDRKMKKGSQTKRLLRYPIVAPRDMFAWGNFLHCDFGTTADTNPWWRTERSMISR
jgi:hypothetical protein